ncbi:hypothetical protein RJ035_008050 [Blastomyces gilchristii]
MTLGQACPPEYQRAQYVNRSPEVLAVSSAGTSPGSENSPGSIAAGPPKQQVKIDKGGQVRGPGFLRSRRSNPPRRVNDPSAGSPTETLLRLLLPLNDQV